MNIHRTRRSAGVMLWVYTTILLLTLSSIFNFNFFSEFNPGGSNSGTPTPVGPKSFSVIREMFPSTLTPTKFVRDFGIRKAQALGHDGLGQTIGFVEVDGEFSQKAFDKFNRQFGLRPATVTVLPRAENLGIHSKEQVVETMVDVEWAHVIAPKAKLLIFDTSKMDKQQIANAITKYHVSVMSDSTQFEDVYTNARDPFVGSRMAGILSLSMSHPYFAGSGDGGQNIAPAALFPNTVIVGGIEGQSKSDRKVWNQAGYGAATGTVIAPSYQRQIFHNVWRHVPDVSWFAGPPGIYTNTPVGWLAEEGTSLSAPLWAALWSLGNENHLAHTGTALPANSNAVLYAIHKADPSAFATPKLNGMPSVAVGLGYPNPVQVVRDLGAFRGRVTPGYNLHFYRFPFYLAFIALALALLVASVAKAFKNRRTKALSIVAINTVSTFLVVFITCVLCNNLDAIVMVRDIAFAFMVIPYVWLMGRLDRWIWNF